MAGFKSPVPLTGDHNVHDFDCGSPAQTEWLRRYARMAQSADTGRVYVATYSEPNRVAGYYALATGAVAQADATERALKGAGRYPISAMILTRLGVDKTAQSQGLGRALVRDAMRRVQQAADIVAARVLLIHAESEDARAFYLRLAEFEASPSDRLHLLLTLKELRAILAG